MEKEFKTIAYIIKNTNGQVVELNDGCYLYLSNEVINSIIYSNDYIFNNSFNEGAKDANSIIESINKEHDNMSKYIKKLEDKLEYYKDYVKKFNDTVNAKEATIAQYIRDINRLNERIKDTKNNINKYINTTNKIDNDFKNDIIEFVNKEFGYKSINDAEPVNSVAYDESEYL